MKKWFSKTQTFLQATTSYMIRILPLGDNEPSKLNPIILLLDVININPIIPETSVIVTLYYIKLNLP